MCLFPFACATRPDEDARPASIGRRDRQEEIRKRVSDSINWRLNEALETEKRGTEGNYIHGLCVSPWKSYPCLSFVFVDSNDCLSSPCLSVRADGCVRGTAEDATSGQIGLTTAEIEFLSLRLCHIPHDPASLLSTLDQIGRLFSWIVCPDREKVDQ